MSSLSFEFSSSSSLSPTSTASSACPTATKGGYFAFAINRGLPEELTLSSDRSVDVLIADLPLLSLGVLAFAVLTFFLAMKRMNRPTIYILLAAGVSFLASVIDLGALLTPPSPSLFALVVAREMGHAVATGIRYLFYWVYCASVPHGEIPVTLRPRSRNSLVLDEVAHSASWTRWGKVGLVGKYVLLILTTAVTVLQVIWRFGAIFRLENLIAVYYTSGYLHIAAAVLVGIKLKLNIFLSPREPRSKALWAYMPVFVCLFIEIGISIGNTIVIRFSESALGRLLQASILYILILLVLITAFRQETSVASPERRPTPIRPSSGESFQAVNVRESFRPLRLQPTPPTDTLGNSLLSYFPPKTTTPQRPRPASRMSTTERLAQWVSERLSGRQDDSNDRNRLWEGKSQPRDVEEKGAVLYQRESKAFQSEEAVDFGSSLTTVPSKEVEVTWKDQSYNVLPVMPPALTIRPAETWDYDGKKRATALTMFSVSRDYGYPRSASPRNSRFPPSPMSDVGRDSPVYGLSGIIQNLADAEQKQATNQDRGAPRRLVDPIQPVTTGLDNSSYSPGMASLVAQQAELDKSIARLGLLSDNDTSSSNNTTDSRKLAPPNQPESERRPSINTTDSLSVSYTSEFSLSNFPSPPPVIKTFLAEGTLPDSTNYANSKNNSPKRSPPKPQQTAGTSFLNMANPSGSSTDVAEGVIDLLPPRMPAAFAGEPPRKLSFPSTRGSDMSGISIPLGAAPKMEGKRWDVTSFIGTLMSPPQVGLDSRHANSSSQDSKLGTLEEVSRGSITSVDIDGTPQAKIVTDVRRIPSVTRARAVSRGLSPLSTPSDLQSGFPPIDTSDSPSTSAATEEPYLTTTAALRVAPKGPTPLPPNPRLMVNTGRVVAAAIPKLTRSPGGFPISSPMPSRDGSSKSFEKPRPVPNVAGFGRTGARDL